MRHVIATTAIVAAVVGQANAPTAADLQREIDKLNAQVAHLQEAVAYWRSRPTGVADSDEVVIRVDRAAPYTPDDDELKHTRSLQEQADDILAGVTRDVGPDDDRTQVMRAAIKAEREAQRLQARAERIEAEWREMLHVYGWDGHRDIILAVEKPTTIETDITVGSFVAFRPNRIDFEAGRADGRDFEHHRVTTAELVQAPAGFPSRPANRDPYWSDR